MRVLLQNTETKLYYLGPDQWTEDRSKALDFEHINQAVQTYTTENLYYAEIVFEPGGSPTDAWLPVASFETRRATHPK